MFPSDYVCSFKNIVVNGQKRGCSGFVELGDSTVYINTESVVSVGFLVRTARNNRDYSGGKNNFANTLEEIVALTVSLLNK